MIALLCAGAFAQGFATVGTGIRPLGIPGIESLTGGGARFGVDFGRVAPFLGASVTLASVDAGDSDVVLTGSSFAAQIGARLEADAHDPLIFPFLSGGAILSRQRGSALFEEDDLITTAGWNNLPGVFGGAGAEADVTDRVGIGLEVGFAGLLGKYVEYDHAPSGRLPTDYFADGKLRALFTYADLHVTFRLGDDR